MSASFGRYEVRSQIGDGAMGRVFEAWDPLLSRTVAVKAVKSEFLTERQASDYLRRFRREAQAAGTLSHPAVVKVFDVGFDYMVMELIEGPTLRALIERAGRFAPADAVKLLAPVADALDYGHRLGVVHRDVKPANIMVQPDGTPKLMDFGVAHIGSAQVTGDGEILGSPSYMSPEQVAGLEARGTSDVYALAVVAYEMLTGQPPFLGTVTQVIYQVMHEAAPAPRQRNALLPPRYDAVFARALHKNPARRYASAAALVAALAPRRGDGRSAAQTVAFRHGRFAPPPRPAMDRRTPIAARSGEGWFAHVDTVAAPRPRVLSSRLLRSSSPTVTLTFTAMLGLAAAASALLLHTAGGPAASLIHAADPSFPPEGTPGAIVSPASREPSAAAATRAAPEPGSARAPGGWRAFLLGRSAGGARRIEGREAAHTAGPGPALVPEPPEPPEPPTRISVFVAPAPAPAPRRDATRAQSVLAPAPTGVSHGQLVELGPGITPPQKIAGRTVLPEKDGVSPLNGTVAISLLIDEHGVPAELAIVESAGALLDRAALASVRTWRFLPARKDGVPVKVRWMARQTYRLTR